MRAGSVLALFFALPDIGGKSPEESLMKRSVVWLALFTLLVSACVSATSRVARPLEVRTDGVDIFACLPLDEGEDVAIQVAGVSAFTVDGQDLPVAWSIGSDLERPSFRLSPGECIAYGEIPSSYSTLIPASELRDEWPYSFVIRSPEWGRKLPQ